MIKCCKDCDKRYLGCHDRCVTYQKEKEEYHKERKALQRDLEASRVNTYEINRANNYTFKKKRK